jgi:hypothetical protein
MTDVVGATDAWWTAELALDRLDAAHVTQLQRAVAGVAGRSGDELSVDTGLADLLADTQHRLLASRAGALTVVLQLFVLAVYALALVARLVLAERVAETALLHSRGTRPRQLAGVAAAEALVLSLPAVVAGPPLASLLVGVLDNAGALAQRGLVLEPVVTPAAIALAIAAGLITVVTLTLPTLTSGRGSAVRHRQRRAGMAQRAGIDLALLAVAAIGYWQLRRAGSPVAAGIRGRLGLDPLLIAAPALSLLAGAVLTLRAVPPLARLSERVAASGRRVVPALGAWQVARRPRTYARAALLPLLALALGLFALSYGRTWDAAQAAIAAQRAGADLLVSPSANAGIMPAQLSGTYSAIDGVRGVVPAWQDTVPISQDVGTAEILAVDTTGVARLAVDREVAAVTAAFAGGRPPIPAVTLPQETPQLDVRVNVTPLAETQPAPVRLDLLLRDGHGLVHLLPTGEVIADGTTTVQRVDLRGVAVPAAIVGAELRFAADRREHQHFRVAIERVDAAGRAPVALGTAEWVAEVEAGDRAEIVSPPRPAPDGAATPVEFNVEVPPTGDINPSGDVNDEATVRLLAGEPTPPDTVRVLVTERFADVLGVAAGDTVPLRLDTLALTASVERVVPTFPTLSAGAETTGVVMDLGTLAALSFAHERRVLEPTSWMLDTTGDPAAVADRVSAPPLVSQQVLDQAAMARGLRSDPVALGVIGALSLGFATAAALAALGFVVAGVAAARERITEFALLRAVGLSARQLVSWLTLEHGILLAGALAGGVLLGGAMSWLILPYASLDASGANQAAVTVEIAWTDVLGLIAFLLAAVCVSVLLLARPLRRLRLGSALRAGEAR